MAKVDRSMSDLSDIGTTKSGQNLNKTILLRIEFHGTYGRNPGNCFRNRNHLVQYWNTIMAHQMQREAPLSMIIWQI